MDLTRNPGGASPSVQAGASRPGAPRETVVPSHYRDLPGGDSQAAGTAREREVAGVSPGMGHGTGNGAARVSSPYGGNGNHPLPGAACPGIPVVHGGEDVKTRYCPQCREDRLFDQPHETGRCPDTGGECPELACTECGLALIVAPAPAGAASGAATTGGGARSLDAEHRRERVA